MKSISRILICAVLMGLFCGMLLPCVNADVFDIGTKVSESDLTNNNNQWFYYDSDCMIQTDPDYKDDAPLIFDGNESTGINKNYGPAHSTMIIWVFFPYLYYINNITVKPSFGGSATNYSLYIFSYGGLIDVFAMDIGTQQTFEVNGKLAGVRIWLDNKGTNQFNFNDVIINYTVNITNIDEAVSAINALSNKVDTLENNIDNLTDHLNEMKDTIDNLNATIFNINQTQQQILENITDIWSFYNLLNESIMNIINDIDNLNISTSENITNLWTTYTHLNESITNFIEDLENLNLTTHENITKIETDLYDIYLSISNITTNISELLKIQDQIDEAALDIDNLNENITEIKNTIPAAYNDTILMEELQQVRSENSKLHQDLANLTTEVENLKGVEKERVIEKEADNSMVNGAIIIGIIGIVIAIIAVVLVLTRYKLPPQPPLEEVPPVPEVEQEPQVGVQEPIVEPPAEPQEQPVPTIKTQPPIED